MLPKNKGRKYKQNSNLVIGLIVCIISGILSACFNFGIEAGYPMAEVANEYVESSAPRRKDEFLYRNNVIYVVLLWGGLNNQFYLVYDLKCTE